jgi:hypothetical protein
MLPQFQLLPDLLPDSKNGTLPGGKIPRCDAGAPEPTRTADTRFRNRGRACPHVSVATAIWLPDAICSPQPFARVHRYFSVWLSVGCQNVSENRGIIVAHWLAEDKLKRKEGNSGWPRRYACSTLGVAGGCSPTA